MGTDFRSGDLVFLTQAYERWMYERNPHLKLSFVNRLARIEDIIDWESPKGKRIKEMRLRSGKWDDLPLEDNKYLLSIFYHDVQGRKKEAGVVEQGVPSFSKYPGTEEPMFVKVPKWIFEMLMTECQKFNVEIQGDVS